MWVRYASEGCRALVRQGRQCLAIVPKEIASVPGPPMKMKIACGILRDACIDGLNLVTELSCVEI